MSEQINRISSSTDWWLDDEENIKEIETINRNVIPQSQRISSTARDGRISSGSWYDLNDIFRPISPDNNVNADVEMASPPRSPIHQVEDALPAARPFWMHILHNEDNNNDLAPEQQDNEIDNNDNNEFPEEQDLEIDNDGDNEIPPEEPDLEGNPNHSDTDWESEEEEGERGERGEGEMNGEIE